MELILVYVIVSIIVMVSASLICRLSTDYSRYDPFRISIAVMIFGTIWPVSVTLILIYALCYPDAFKT